MATSQQDLRLERRVLCSRALWTESFAVSVVLQAMNGSALPSLVTKRSMARNSKELLVLMAFSGL